MLFLPRVLGASRIGDAWGLTMWDDKGEGDRVSEWSIRLTDSVESSCERSERIGLWAGCVSREVDIPVEFGKE